MPLEEVIAGFTFTGFTTLPPTIPGLQALGIFGSGKDGKNTNRAPGGPAFSNLTNPPTYGSGWATVNNGTSTGTPTQGIDTNFAETSTVNTSGWTEFVVARTAIVSGNAAIMGMASLSTNLVLNPAFATVSSHPSCYISVQGTAFTGAEAALDLGTSRPTSGWGMFALSYPAGSGARAYRISDVTGNTEKTTTSTWTRPNGAAQHFTVGFGATTLPANSYQFADVAAAGVCNQPLTLVQLQSIRTWLQGVLSVRGVTGF